MQIFFESVKIQSIIFLCKFLHLFFMFFCFCAIFLLFTYFKSKKITGKRRCFLTFDKIVFYCF